MNFDRYLATHYPFFHRTSVTKAKLFTLFAFAAIIQTTLMGMSINDLVIPYEIGLLICCIIFIPPMLFTNYKLFTIARKSRIISPEMKKSFSLKNISSILLVAVSLLVLFIPTFVYIGLKPVFHGANLFARREAKTRIRQRDWLKLAGEKIRREQVGSVPIFLSVRANKFA